MSEPASRDIGGPPRGGGDLGAVAVAATTWVGATWARPVATGVIGAVVVAVVVGTGRRGAGRAVLVAVLLAGAAGVLAQRSLDGLRIPAAVHADADAEGPWPVTWTATLVTDPDPTPDGRTRVDVRAEGRRWWAEARAPAAVAVVGAASAGDRILVRGTVADWVERPDWATGRHLAGRLRIESVDAVGRPGPAAAAANGFRALLARGAASLPERHRALLAGLTLGDDRAQPPTLAADFRAAGLTHLLVVSGQNLALVLLVAAPVLARLRLWPRFVASAGLVLAFAAVTRFEPSVVRASAVAGVVLWATLSGRRSTGVRHLAVAVTGLLLVDPLLTRSIGFRLSVAACLGVLVLAPPIVARIPGPRWVAGGLGLTAGAQLAVAPVLVPTFGAVPLASLPANVVAGPLAAATVTWGLTGGVVAGLSPPPVAAAIHVPTGVLLGALEATAAAGAAAPLGEVDLRHVAVSALAAALLALAGRSCGTGPARDAAPTDGRRSGRAAAVAGPVRVAAGALVAACLVLPGVRPVPRGAVAAGWAATVWSDGPAAVVDIDDGADPEAVLGALRRRRVRTVPLVVVRAARPELADVVAAVADRFPVGTVLAPASHRLPTARVPAPGERWRVGGTEVVVDAVEPTLRVRIGRARAP